ncbi:MAG: flagellar hook-basal body complex protein [Rickettsiaceae bacterium]|nr:flagellar hook-basal body complex protein [Rickettsiaceae bacterium]
MAIALHTALTGAQVALDRIDIWANNIANSDTNGFKAQEIQTADLFYTKFQKAGIQENTEAERRPVGIQYGMGTKTVGTSMNAEQGAIRVTSNPLDIALTASGWLAVTLPNGRTGYTRDGSLKRTSEGILTTFDGKPLANNIVIPEDIPTNTINISNDGLITAPDPEDPANLIELGQLEIFTFNNESGLQRIGNNILLETFASGEAIIVADTTDHFEQGALEQSNTASSIEGMTKIIQAQRQYELNVRVIRIADEMEKEANNLKS